MSEAKAKKLNINSLDVPRAFFGKERHREYGSAAFVPKNGARRFTATKILQLGLMHTENIMFGNLNTMPYSAFTDELYCSRPTVGRNLQELDADKIIKKIRKSKYEILADYSEEKTVTVYSFLLEEKLKLGGRVKRLSKNAVLYLSEAIAAMLEGKNGGKYFIGGNKRVATLLNVAHSTAWYVIKELIDTKALYIKCLHYDEAGNEIIKSGAGSSSKEITVYEVNDEILRRCRAIEKEKAELRAVKTVFGQNVKKPQERPAPTERRGHYGKYTFAEGAQGESDISKLHTAFDTDETVINIKQRYKKLKGLFVNALRSGNMQELDELEQEMNDVQDELREYLINSGAPPDVISENLTEYIND